MFLILLFIISLVLFIIYTKKNCKKEMFINQIYEHLNKNIKNYLIDNDYLNGKGVDLTKKYEKIPKPCLKKTYKYINPWFQDKIKKYAKNNLNKKSVRFSNPY